MSSTAQWVTTRVQRAAIASLVAVLSACGTPAPTPVVEPSTPAPTASIALALPSPSLADAVKPFLDTIASPLFSAAVEIDGEYSAGGATYGLSGEYDVHGLDSHQTFTVRAPGVASREIITAFGRTYGKRGVGPWFFEAAPKTELRTFFRSISSVQDLGLETRTGQQVHHLTIPTGLTIPPAALGITDPTITGVTGTVDAYVTAAGVPVAMSVKETWQQTVATKPGTGGLNVELTFTRVGLTGTVAIIAPTDVWKMFKSKIYHYALGAPIDWDFFPSKSTKRLDFYAGPSYVGLQGGRFPTQGLTLNTITRLAAKIYGSFLTKVHVDSTKSITVAGKPARRLLVHGTYKGVKQYWVTVVVLKSGYFYEVDVIDKSGHEKADQLLSDQAITTFAFK